jgi:hypothetical protein
MDEAFKALIMLGSALVYSAVLLGPWGWLKISAYQVGSFPWLAYAFGFLIFVFVLLPGTFALAIAGGRRLAGTRTVFDRRRLRSDFIQLAYALVPLGLAAWMAFTLSFVFANLSYLGPVLSDPFSRGWNLFGTASLAWTPYLTGIVPALQAVVLMVGLAWAIHVAIQISSQILASEKKTESAGIMRLVLPFILFCLAVTAGLMGLLIA